MSVRNHGIINSQQSRNLRAKLLVVQLVKILPVSYGTRSSLSRRVATNPFPEPNESN